MQYFTATSRSGVTRVWCVPRLQKLARSLPVHNVHPMTLWDKNFKGRTDCHPRNADLLMYFQQVLKVNLRYPVILDARGQIMDGYHRAMKAMILRRPWIRVVQFESTPPPDRVER